MPRKCEKCGIQLITLGFGYYSHPPLKDHFSRIKDDVYQCPQAYDVEKLP